ncbi:hypothetical protein QQ045_008067 [Rhodiola kirilowii]
MSPYTISISNTFQKERSGRAPMAMVMEVEDDVFFADLNRQISLLITEDDDDDSYNYPIPPHSSHPPVVSIDQAFSRTPIFQSTTQPHYKFDQISNKTCTTDRSKGTGVFIPKSSHQWSRSIRSRRTGNKQHQTKTTNTDSNYYISYTNN